MTDTKTTPIELVRRVLRECNSFPNNDATPFGLDCKQLAQAVLDNSVGLTKGERMPQTPEQFAYMAEKYEEALLREKDVISRLNAKLNKLEQKVTKARQRGHAEGVREQKEKDIILIEYTLPSHDPYVDGLVMAIRENNNV